MRVRVRVRVRARARVRARVRVGRAGGLVVGVGQVGEDDLAALLLRLQLERELAEVVAVGAAVGLVGRLAAATAQAEGPVGRLRHGDDQPARLVARGRRVVEESALAHTARSAHHQPRHLPQLALGLEREELVAQREAAAAHHRRRCLELALVLVRPAEARVVEELRHDA